MTTPTTDPTREPGYRGTLPPRRDRLAKPWLLIVGGIFVLIILFSILGVPSRFIPDPTPIPTPVTTPQPSAEPSASAAASGEASASAESSPAPSAPASVEPSPSN